jgi:hypothetical protein
MPDSLYPVEELAFADAALGPFAGHRTGVRTGWMVG